MSPRACPSPPHFSRPENRRGFVGALGLWAAVALVSALPLAVSAQVTPLGKGSYATRLPKDQDGNTLKGPKSPAPEPAGEIQLAAPVQTNDWWTSHVFKWSAAPAQIPMGSSVLPQPLMLLPEWDGLAIKQMHTYYWESRHGGQGPGFKQVMCPTGLAGECWDLLVLDPTPTHFTEASGARTVVQSYSTWFVSFKMLPGTDASGRAEVQATCGRGSPFAWVEISKLVPDSDPWHYPSVEAKSENGTTPPAAYLPPDFASADTSANGSTQGAATDKNVLSVSVNGRHYALFGPAGSYWKWIRFANHTVNFYLVLPGWPTPSSANTYVVVAALPQNLDQLVAAGSTRKGLMAPFQQAAYLKPANTGSTLGSTFTPHYDGSGTASGRFAFNLVDLTTGQQAPGAETLFALFPHQVDHLEDPSQLLSPEQRYTTPWGYAQPADETSPSLDPTKPHAGQMRLARGSGFTLRYAYGGVLPPVLDKAGGSWDPATMQGYLAWDLQNTAYPTGVDTYNWGKHLSRLAEGYLIGQQAAWSQSEKFLAALKTGLSQWFTADDGSGGIKTVHTDTSPSMPPVPGLFCYDGSWGLLTGYPAGYGSDEWLNDHHFHYGYFIRAAATLAGADAQWKADYAPMVGLLVRDIAADYGDPLFPPYRCFDPYAGHSVAAGVQPYADGANQESTSEAINAWYGMILWGQATGDTAVRDRGIYLYASEVDAARRYWFLEDAVTDGTFKLPSKTLTDLYDGLVEYNSFFSQKPEGLHIINYLPFGGGSLYLGANRPYAAANYGALLKEKGGSTAWENYSDLIWMYRALSDGADAQAQMKAGIGTLAPDSGNTRAMTYHWVTTAPNHGESQSGNSSDCPTAMAFQDPADSSLLYVAHSETSAAITYADGHVLEHPGGGYWAESSGLAPSYLGLEKGSGKLDVDEWTFPGEVGLGVTFTLRESPFVENSGERATLTLKGPPGSGFKVTRKGKLPLTLTALPPAAGVYTLAVREQAGSAPGKKFRGGYFLQGTSRGWSAHLMEAAASVEGADRIEVMSHASPPYGHAPLDVELTAVAEGGIPPYRFSWEGPDLPTPVEGQIVHVQFTTPGYKAIWLHVSDQIGNQTYQGVWVKVD